MHNRRTKALEKKEKREKKPVKVKEGGSKGLSSAFKSHKYRRSKQIHHIKWVLLVVLRVSS